MGSDSDTVSRGDTPPALQRVRASDGRAPWWVYALSEFITKTGFPILIALLLMAYVWFIGLKTNELMTRAVVILEKFEQKSKDGR